MSSLNAQLLAVIERWRVERGAAPVAAVEPSFTEIHHAFNQLLAERRPELRAYRQRKGRVLSLPVLSGPTAGGVS